MGLWGQTTLTLSGLGTITCPATPSSTWTTPPTGITISAITRGSGVTCNTFTNGINGQGFNGSLATNLSSDRWYTFNLANNSTSCFNLNSINVITRVSSAAGSPNVSVQYSLNGGTTKNVIGSITPTTSDVTYSFNSLGINVPSSTTIIFYIVPNTLTTSGTTCRVSNGTSVNITSNPTASVLSTTTPAICNGGAAGNIRVAITGGTSPYTVVYNDGAGNTTQSSYTSGSNISLTPSSATTYSLVSVTDANSCASTGLSGTPTITPVSGAANATLAGSSATPVEQCTDGAGWTYYATSGAPTQLLFAINKNGNTFTATPNITVGTTIVKTSSNGANQEHGMWLMGRYWDATLASGSISSSLPVSVRFYYDPADTLSAFNARDAAFTALPGTTFARKNPRGEWFKTPNGTVFNSAYIGTIIGNKFPTGGVLKPTTVTGTQNGVNYVEYQGLTGFSGGTIGFSFGPNNGGGANGLPVTWAGFDASVQRDYTELIWHTASEQNTSHFEVEASVDGKAFIKLGENIAAAGNSASLLSYSFRDMDLAPIKYYRLKQVDIEGTFEYSKIIVAKRSEGEKQDFDMVVYPVSENNNKQYHLLLKNKIEDISAIQIVDYTGKPVFHMTSSNNAELLDLNFLTPGIYMIQVWNGEEKQVERVVVQ